MNETTVSPTTTQDVQPKRGWKLCNVDGNLYDHLRRGGWHRVKRLFADGNEKYKPLQRVSGGCPFIGREQLLLSAQRTSVDGVPAISVTITYELLDYPPYTFLIKEGYMCEVWRDGTSFRLEKIETRVRTVKKVNGKTDIKMCVEEKKIEIPKPVLTASLVLYPRFLFQIQKHKVSPVKIPRMAIQFWNDGQHLHYIDNLGIPQWIRFQNIKREVWVSSFIPNVAFMDNFVLIKSLGHTLSGDVIVTLRDMCNSWSITLLIHRSQFIAIDDYCDKLIIKSSKRVL